LPLDVVAQDALSQRPGGTVLSLGPVITMTGMP
jgi:hypothetical protein